MTKLNVEFKDKKVLSEDSITGGAFFLEQRTQDLYVVAEIVNEENNDHLDPFMRSLQPRQEAFRYNLVNVSSGKMFCLQNRSKYQLFNKMLRHVFTPINSMKISINQ